MHTITYDGITITVQGETGADELVTPSIRRIILSHLLPDTEIKDVPDHTFVVAYTYAMLVTQTVKVDGLPFAFPSRYSGDKALIEGFHALMESPEYKALANEWYIAIQAVNAPPSADPNVTPPTNESELSNVLEGGEPEKTAQSETQSKS